VLQWPLARGSFGLVVLSLFSVDAAQRGSSFLFPLLVQINYVNEKTNPKAGFAVILVP